VLADWSGSLRIDALLWLVFLVCLVGLGEALAREPYADYLPRSQPQQGFAHQQDHFRWRPLNEDEENLRKDSSAAGSSTTRGQSQTVLYPPTFTDYADAPPGLPRGVYRPVEQRHTIVPHVGEYRFRTLGPDEQQRIKRRNERYNQSWQPKQDEPWSSPSSGGGYSYSEPQDQEAYRFRPDKRLDKKRDSNWGRSDLFPYNPAFTEAYPAPMFRPE
jgi:hypothetical protein